MTRRHEVGDVHAPVEDVEVPLSLKVLVILMLSVLGALAIALVLAAEAMGLLRNAIP
jgi:hypothetical protein